MVFLQACTGLFYIVFVDVVQRVDALDQTAFATFQFNATMGLGNPWIGFVPYAPAAPPGEGIFPHSMENFYVPMSSLMVGWGNFTWVSFERHLDEIAARGNQAIICPCFDCPGFPQGPMGMAGTPEFLREGLKFYNDSGGAMIPDWLNTTVQRAMTSLIGALGKKYDGDNRIAMWEVGFLGKWGEWHDDGEIPPRPTFPAASVCRLILLAYNSSFQTSAMTVRYPGVLGGLDPNTLRIGFYDDSFAQDTLDDGEHSLPRAVLLLNRAPTWSLTLQQRDRSWLAFLEHHEVRACGRYLARGADRW